MNYLHTHNQKTKEFKGDDKNSQCQLKKKRQRQENSLGELTKSFIDFVKAKGSDQININDIVKKLKVKKRRIYDITNVLEGIGYIKKLAKNQIMWIKKDLIIQNNNLTSTATKSNSKLSCNSNERDINDILNLQHENERLDSYIKIIQNEFKRITDLPESKEYAYVTVDDLKHLAKCDNQNLIAIKAPQGTTIEIPDKESTKEAYKHAEKQKDEDPTILESLKMEHQMFMESQNGEITVYLVITDDNGNEGNNAWNPTPSIHSCILSQNKNDKNTFFGSYNKKIT